MLNHGKYTATPSTLADGSNTPLRTDSSGALAANTIKSQFFFGTVTPLAANGVYLGPVRDCGADAGAPCYWASLVVAVRTDQAAATGGAIPGICVLQADSPTGPWYPFNPSAVSANTTSLLTVPILHRYQRTQLTNGATAQTSLWLMSRYQ